MIININLCDQTLIHVKQPRPLLGLYWSRLIIIWTQLHTWRHHKRNFQNFLGQNIINKLIKCPFNPFSYCFYNCYDQHMQWILRYCLLILIIMVNLSKVIKKQQDLKIKKKKWKKVFFYEGSLIKVFFNFFIAWEGRFEVRKFCACKLILNFWTGF